jgi:hypothetical protein
MRYSIRTNSRESTDEVGVSLNDIDFNPDKFHPLLYHLPKVEWAVMGTVTWSRASRRADTLKASIGRKYDFDGVLYRTCKKLHLRVSNIGIYHATEFGASCECHIHFLVAKDGLKQVTPEKFAQDFSHLWSKEFRPFHRCGDWAGFVNPGVGKAEVEPYIPAYGQRGVAYCLKREPDDYGRDRERYDYMSKKLFSIIRRVDTQPIVPSLPSAHSVVCSGRFFGQILPDFENAGQPGPNQRARPEASPLPADPVVRVESVASGQPGLKLVVEVPFSVRLGVLWN